MLPFVAVQFYVFFVAPGTHSSHHCVANFCRAALIMPAASNILDWPERASKTGPPANHSAAAKDEAHNKNQLHPREKGNPVPIESCDDCVCVPDPFG